MELEFFCKPGTDLEWFEYWRGFCRDWLIALGIKEDQMRLRDHDKEELSFLFKCYNRYRIPLPVRLGRALGNRRQNGL